MTGSKPYHDVQAFPVSGDDDGRHGARSGHYLPDARRSLLGGFQYLQLGLLPVQPGVSVIKNFFSAIP